MKQLPKPSRSVRLAVIGVGQVLRGDDGAGPAVIESLQRLVAPSPNLLLINAGHAPENVLGPVIRFAPTLVIYVDAARSDERLGTVRWLTPSEVEETGGSTHTLSLGMIAEYIQANTSAQVLIAAIQPKSLKLYSGLSTEINEATERVAEEIAGYWRKATTACSAITSGGVSVVSS